MATTASQITGASCERAPQPLIRRAKPSGWLSFVTTAVALILIAHGGIGYQQSKPLLFAGMLFLVVITAIWLVQRHLRMSGVQLSILLLTVVLIYVPATIGLLNFGNTAGFVFLITNVLVFLFFSQLVETKGDESLRFVCIVFIVAAALSTVAAVYLLFNALQVGGLQFGRPGYMRLVGPFSTPNRFGEVAALGTLAATHVFISYKKRRFWSALLAAFFFAVTLASGSKGVILGLLPALASMLFIASAWRKRFFLKALAVLLPVLIVLLYRFYDLLLLVTKLDQVQQGKIDIGSGREEIWKSGAELFLSAPIFSQLFGHGTTGFVSMVGIDPHSMYWILLFDYGLVNLAALALLVACMMTLLVSRVGNRASLMLGFSLIVFCLVRGISMPTIFKEGNFAMVGFWAGVAIMFCFSRQRYPVAWHARSSP